MMTRAMIGALGLALAACVLGATAASAQAPASMPPPPSVKVGQAAPDFTARYLAPADANGRRQGMPVTLSEFDSAWANAAFAEKLGVRFNILSDAKRDISRAYGVFDEQAVIARRTTFVIDRQGVVQKVFMAQEALDPNSALEVCALLKEVK